MAENSLDVLVGNIQSVRHPMQAWAPPCAIDDDEWGSAKPAPDCIVQGLLYADVGLQIAPGGTGKTTLNLFLAINIVLGRRVFGLEIRKRGAVLILTAEDTREMLVARLRAICGGMDLTDDEVKTVRRLVRISDVSACPTKLTAVFDEVVRPNHVVDEIIDGCRGDPPVLIIVDPAVSFGVGESRVNDAEQGLIEAARKIRSALNCCVMYVHHSGKANAKEKALDQYAGRGGSSFADGSRMVLVLASYTTEQSLEWEKITGYPLGDGETGIVMARPKLSYAPPQPPIYIVRRGYSFEAITPVSRDARSQIEAIVEQVYQFISEEFKAGRFHSKKSLEAYAKTINIKRTDMRDCVALLEERQRIEIRSRSHEGRGGMTHYFHPSASPSHRGEAVARGTI